MWLRLLFRLAMASGFCGIALPADLQNEDLRSVQEAFRKTDASLEGFAATGKTPLDGARSVMVVRAWPGRQWNPEKARIGIFVVAGTSNRVQLVLDVVAENEVGGLPVIDRSGVTQRS